jgi:hypothetical protein
MSFLAFLSFVSLISSEVGAPEHPAPVPVHEGNAPPKADRPEDLVDEPEAKNGKQGPIYDLRFPQQNPDPQLPLPPNPDRRISIPPSPLEIALGVVIGSSAVGLILYIVYSNREVSVRDSAERELLLRSREL